MLEVKAFFGTLLIFRDQEETNPLIQKAHGLQLAKNKPLRSQKAQNSGKSSPVWARILSVLYPCDSQGPLS